MTTSSKIQLIVGLGNPGRPYHATRHNAGAWFVEALANIHHITLRAEKRFNSLYGEYSTEEGKIILLLPQTFMNLSGGSVQAASHYFHIPAENILIAHDELDLPAGSVKLKFGGNPAGHNGLKDTINKLGTQAFWRLRIGIDHPRKQNSAQPVVDYVLSKPNQADRQTVDDAITRATHVENLLYRGSFDTAMLQLHTP